MSERDPAEMLEEELRRLPPLPAPEATAEAIAQRMASDRRWIAPGNRFLAGYLATAAAAVVVAICMVGADWMERHGGGSALVAGEKAPAESYAESRALLLELAAGDARWPARP